jgi:DNA invertase Pin-like site-specific DNA recombinase
MPFYGYARVSTIDQYLGVQPVALKAAGCDVIRAEKASGTRRDGRTELQVLLDFLRRGDTLVVTRITGPVRRLQRRVRLEGRPRVCARFSLEGPIAQAA